MAHDVFVSYSSHDKPTADAVVARLEAARLRCWIAPRDILPGMEWGEGILDGISRSRLMVLVFSSSANASPQIRREVERAVNKGLPIVPFRIEEVMPSRSLEYFLSSPHWLDALTPPVEAHIQKLIDSVRTLLTRMDGAATQTAPPAPPASPSRARVQKVLDTVLGRPPKV
ncbi:MAG TPA: toll/interleukin-1 receptor domain-containing protein, partial [Thermoanaerobaculia bacterium]|nr:toll/interleukin-1 receptor domain-containing protein [Thermoanaerobaculia bacterium]